MFHASAPQPSPTRPERAAPAGGQSQRVIFVDLARALAVLFMLYGHTVDALLAPDYRVGAWYRAWQFQRGLTSTLFLLLSGFAFSVATSKRWSSHLHLSPKVAARLRRFGLFVLLGYALHYPVTSLTALARLSEGQWRSFLAVDVLQLIGVSLIALQLLVLVTRTTAVFTAVALLLASVVVVVTPWMWAHDWQSLPRWAAPYLSPAAGSLFPLFPWCAYVLFGSALGQVFARWGPNLTTYANAVLLAPGGALLAAGLLLRLVAAPALDWERSSFFVPTEVLIRTGAALLIVGGIAHGTRRLSHLPRVFSAVAQETLLIYFVHLCIVYGSIWSPGLSRLFGRTLHPLHVLAIVIALIAAMATLAFYWNALKHTSPPTARRVSIAVGAALALWLV